MNKLIIILISLLLTSCSSKSWREMSRESAGLAPLASELKESIVLIYYARAYSWRGNLAVHPWISWKQKEDKEYTVAQVTSWNIRREGTAVRVEQDLPDRKWFDSMPTLMFEARGDKADRIIKQLKEKISNYPYQDIYRVWPGPNSNTFVAHMTREIEEIDVEMPPHAIGKDYLGTSLISNTASNTGGQVSLFGVAGVTVGLKEGVEVNALGLSFGVDVYPPAIKLPFVGRLGFKDI